MKLIRLIIEVPYIISEGNAFSYYLHISTMAAGIFGVVILTDYELFLYLLLTLLVGIFIGWKLKGRKTRKETGIMLTKRQHKHFLMVQPTVRTCTICGRKVPKDSKFCKHCGTKFST